MLSEYFMAGKHCDLISQNFRLTLRARDHCFLISRCGHTLFPVLELKRKRTIVLLRLYLATVLFQDQGTECRPAEFYFHRCAPLAGILAPERIANQSLLNI
jgi:hypothetical protein